MKKLLILSVALYGCSDIERVEPQKNHIGCYCWDGTYKVQDYNLLRETGNLTGNPCFDHGGIKSYVYPGK